MWRACESVDVTEFKNLHAGPSNALTLADGSIDVTRVKIKQNNARENCANGLYALETVKIESNNDASGKKGGFLLFNSLFFLILFNSNTVSQSREA